MNCYFAEAGGGSLLLHTQDIVFATFTSPRKQESCAWDEELNTNKLCLITHFKTVNFFAF